jgi:hypothetical protein
MEVKVQLLTACTLTTHVLASHAEGISFAADIDSVSDHVVDIFGDYVERPADARGESRSRSFPFLELIWRQLQNCV